MADLKVQKSEIAQHHEVFSAFDRWTGACPAGFSVNFLGVFTRDSFFTVSGQNTNSRYVVSEFPAFDEEYFEWIDLLEAVIAAKAEFRMIELGAGYGRWSVNAAAALRQRDGLPYRLIAVEPEPTHFEWMKLHFKDNGLNSKRCKLIRAAVADEDGPVWFYVGKPAEWYGQAIAPVPDFSSRRFRRLHEIFARKGVVQGYEVRKVKAVSFDRLLKGLTHVDLIDLDVQGTELIVLSSAVEQLSQKVKRVHIGTHGEEIESGLRTLFQNLGWTKLNDYACGSESETPWGVIKFGDGVQTWINPKLT